jgi:hypothetical protein
MDHAMSAGLFRHGLRTGLQQREPYLTQLLAHRALDTATDPGLRRSFTMYCDAIDAGHRIKFMTAKIHLVPPVSEDAYVGKGEELAALDEVIAQQMHRIEGFANGSTGD